jgi:hypothetical protein
MHTTTDEVSTPPTPAPAPHPSAQSQRPTPLACPPGSRPAAAAELSHSLCRPHLHNLSRAGPCPKLTSPRCPTSLVAPRPLARPPARPMPHPLSPHLPVGSEASHHHRHRVCGRAIDATDLGAGLDGVEHRHREHACMRRTQRGGKGGAGGARLGRGGGAACRA